MVDINTKTSYVMTYGVNEVMVTIKIFMAKPFQTLIKPRFNVSRRS